MLNDEIQIILKKVYAIETDTYYWSLAWTKWIRGKKYGDYILHPIDMKPLEILQESSGLLIDQCKYTEEFINES